MNNAIEAFVTGVLALCGLVMLGVGTVDDTLGMAMTSVGIDPNWQLSILLVLTAALVVFVMRVLGGLLGWVVLLLLVLLLLHRIVPGMVTPTIMPLASLKTAF
ncbi:MAG TPA: hypothetical protein VMV54_06605 [Acidocella sp.]|nr:hypothetical protein [Acidocella sp.]